MDTDKVSEQKAREEADAKFQELINSPLSKEDAEKELANNDINRMQLMTVRQKWQTQITQLQLQISNLDEQLHACDSRLIRFRNPGKSHYEVIKEQCELPFTKET